MRFTRAARMRTFLPIRWSNVCVLKSKTNHSSMSRNLCCTKCEQITGTILGSKVKGGKKTLERIVCWPLWGFAVNVRERCNALAPSQADFKSATTTNEVWNFLGRNTIKWKQLEQNCNKNVNCRYVWIMNTESIFYVLGNIVKCV